MKRFLDFRSSTKMIMIEIIKKELRQNEKMIKKL